MLEDEVVEKGDENRKQDGRHPVAADECAHQPSSQIDPHPNAVSCTLVWPVRTFGLEILDDRSSPISLMHGFLYISHWNLTYH